MPPLFILSKRWKLQIEQRKSERDRKREWTKKIYIYILNNNPYDMSRYWNIKMICARHILFSLWRNVRMSHKTPFIICIEMSTEATETRANKIRKREKKKIQIHIQNIQLSPSPNEHFLDISRIVRPIKLWLVVFFSISSVLFPIFLTYIKKSIRPKWKFS